MNSVMFPFKPIECKEEEFLSRINVCCAQRPKRLTQVDINGREVQSSDWAPQRKDVGALIVGADTRSIIIDGGSEVNWLSKQAIKHAGKWKNNLERKLRSTSIHTFHVENVMPDKQPLGILDTVLVWDGKPMKLAMVIV